VRGQIDEVEPGECELVVTFSVPSDLVVVEGALAVAEVVAGELRGCGFVVVESTWAECFGGACEFDLSIALDGRDEFGSIPLGVCFAVER
jgi:hypothetical protein